VENSAGTFFCSCGNELDVLLNPNFFHDSALGRDFWRRKTTAIGYCGRGQLLGLIGEKLKLSRSVPPPKFLRARWFRYGFLTFFMSMFVLMLFSTYKVFTGAPLEETVTLLWLFKLPWQWADVGMVSPWIAQFAFGFYSVMLTSEVLGFFTMILYRPRSWCVYCPMGTMTQGICTIKHGKEVSAHGRKS